MRSDESRMAALARQYDWLRARGTSHEDAVAQLRANIDQKQQTLLDRLLGRATDPDGVTDSSPDPLVDDMLGNLGHLVNHAATPEQRGKLVMGGAALNAHFRELGAKVREQSITRFSYMTFICLTGVIVSAVYTIYVHPQIVHMKALTMNQHLSSPSAVYNLGLLGYPLLFLVLFILVGSVYGLSLRSSFTLGTRKEFAAPLHRLPGLGALNRMLKQYVSINLYSVYINSDFDSTESHRLASQTAGDMAPETLDSLSLAQTLGTLDQELNYQREHAQSTLESTLDRTTSLWHRGFTVAIALATLMMLQDYYGHLFYGAV